MGITQSKLQWGQHESLESSKDREQRDEVQVSHCLDTPPCLYGFSRPVKSLGSVGVPQVLRAPPTLPRHQVLRISAADEAQVQKVRELEELEHLQVRDSVQASLRIQETS